MSKPREKTGTPSTATVPINHMVVVKGSLSMSNPDITVREIFRMFLASKKAAGLPKAGAIDFDPFGFDAPKTALDLMSSYCLENETCSEALFSRGIV